jgi:catechol 2,3-dioxygenase-like lactoylglutathione lyase family enzyme
MPPKTNGILESSLYVSDMPRSIRFYEQTFGFRVIADFGRGCAIHAGAHQVLLLFKKRESRDVPSPHDGVLTVCARVGLSFGQYRPRDLVTVRP